MILMTVVVHLGAEDAELTLLLVFTQLFSFHTEFHPQIFEIEQVELLDISQNQISLDHYFSINALWGHCKMRSKVAKFDKL